jgi:hypothetical protein
MELPQYFICGARPVKFVPTDDGGMEILAFDWKTGDFVPDASYLTRCTFPDGEVDVVTEAEFEREVALHRRWQLRHYYRLISNTFRWLRSGVTPGRQ